MTLRLAIKLLYVFFTNIAPLMQWKFVERTLLRMIFLFCNLDKNPVTPTSVLKSWRVLINSWIFILYCSVDSSMYQFRHFVSAGWYLPCPIPCSSYKMRLKERILRIFLLDNHLARLIVIFTTSSIFLIEWVEGLLRPLFSHFSSSHFDVCHFVFGERNSELG